MIKIERFTDESGDYYGTIYKGPFIGLLLAVGLVVSLFWWILKSLS